MRKLQTNKAFRAAPAALIGGAMLACGNIIGAGNRFYTAFTLIPLAVILYFYYVLFVADGNWMDIRAVFSGAWIGTIGLAALRLTDYQEPWQNKTWLLVGLAYALFVIGATVGLAYGKKVVPAIAKRMARFHVGRLRLQLHENRLFWICVICTLLGLACFAANVAIRGYIPCFRISGNAEYLDFYTKFHVFAVAATGISGLCYYCLVKQKHSVLKKIVLLLCIFYSTFAFPILVVSRGTFVTSALSLTVVVFYVHRRKFLVLVTCLAVIFGVYYASSQLRGYTDAQLQVFFEPSVIAKPGSPNTSPSDDGSYVENPSDEVPEEVPVFQLSPKLSFLYSYLTVSHDNFNEAVQNSKRCAYGVRQFTPFNVILRSQKINQAIEDSEQYLVRPHLNTTNVIGDFYYDFHTWGIVICMLLWAFVFGVMQSCTDVFKGPFSFMTMGNTMAPVALCFFSTWLSLFSHWMHWGVVLLLAIAAYITVQPRDS